MFAAKPPRSIAAPSHTLVAHATCVFLSHLSILYKVLLMKTSALDLLSRYRRACVVTGETRNFPCAKPRSLARTIVGDIMGKVSRDARGATSKSSQQTNEIHISEEPSTGGIRRLTSPSILHRRSPRVTSTRLIRGEVKKRRRLSPASQPASQPAGSPLHKRGREFILHLKFRRHRAARKSDLVEVAPMSAKQIFQARAVARVSEISFVTVGDRPAPAEGSCPIGGSILRKDLPGE